MGKRRAQGEGSIYYDVGRKRWRGEIRIDGRRHRVTARTKTDASAAIGRLLHGDAAELTTETADTTSRLALDAKQLRALFDACEDHPHGAMFVVMGTLGLRPGEAAGLCDDAVDLHKRTLSVVRAVQLEHGRPVLTTDLKTAASRRTLKLPSAALEALRKHEVVARHRGE